MSPKQSKRSGKSFAFGLLLVATAIAAAAAVYGFGLRSAEPPKPGRASEAEPQKAPPPVAAAFRMIDFEHGWMRYTDGTVKITADGGTSWREALEGEAGTASPADGSTEAAAFPFDWSWIPGGAPNPSEVSVDGKTYAVKQSQFATDRIGWVLPADGSQLADTLLVTVDGGATWHTLTAPEVVEAIRAEKERLAEIARERALYESEEEADRVMSLDWALLPERASPGDVVLVRSRQAGEISWQGKAYPLQPFGLGYYTYLPIPKSVKPDAYPIGDRILTVEAKKFDTQYLQVSKEMESMRQDTARIQADQKKIDAARAKSEPRFLFDSTFVKPVEGILTTPYGYTRYVNGKLDSSHMAIDLAAKEGTPVQATNDGIVALADSLYLTGNSIYIDHGMGLFSQYAHLSKLLVKTGDRVKKGDIIGLVGTTGFSTGPHLHFTFWAHNIQANPDLFFGKTPFLWSEGG